MTGVLHYFVIFAWTFMSACSVGLAAKVIGWAREERRESELDLAALYELGYHEMEEKRDKMDLAEDEVGQAAKLLLVQVLFCVHQAIFLSVGILSFLYPTFPHPEDFLLVSGVINPLLLVVAQLLVVLGQVFVASLIFGKTRTRKIWSERHKTA